MDLSEHMDRLDSPGWTPDDFAIAHGKLHASSNMTVVEPMVADKFPEFTRHMRGVVCSFPIG